MLEIAGGILLRLKECVEGLEQFMERVHAYRGES
jgi:hypothetical protein